MSATLAGKTALVTGASRGIGEATARAVAREGAAVVLAARSAARLEEVATEIRHDGGEARAIAADVGDVDQVRSTFEQAGPVDILINSAGILQPVGTVLDDEPDAWSRNIAINLDGVFYTCHYALPSMLDRGWGRIVNVSSGAARGSQVRWSAYSAAKAGVEALTAVLAKEVGEQGVHVNAVRPGIVDTQMQAEIRSSAEQFGAENVERYQRYHDRGMLRSPEDPARLILWLLSPQANDMNGQTLAIDDQEVAAKIGLVPIGR
ncbi:MAG: SDR family NAD(P)-dependent oxidoreductase [Chloroflexota bacterium]